MKKYNDNIILAILGVAGAGKGSVSSILRKYPETFGFSVSYVNRAPRPDETPGVEYNFVSDAEFDEKVKKGEFLEWEHVHDNKYGTGKADFDGLLESGKIPVLEVDVKGLKNLKKKYNNIVSFFIIPPSVEIAMERLKKRRTETEEQIALRVSRYQMEMEEGKKCDHIIINDDLARAQNELLNIIEIERTKKHDGAKIRKIVSFFSLILFTAVTIGLGLAQANFWEKQKLASQDSESSTVATTQTLPTVSSDQTTMTATPKTSPPEKQVVKSASPTKEIKQKIAAEPPKTTVASSTPIVAETQKNTDGSTTTVVTTGGSVTSADLSQTLSGSTTKISTPQDIVYKDETGRHGELGTVLKDYLNTSLKWKNEVSYLTNITLRDAGQTGWTGQYLGSYTIAPDGKDIVSATGSIILNTSYYENSSLFIDYMKLTLSHEYGHHYTLWHKWVEWDLPISTRFPDSYYTLRSLSKSTTATDYSLGWQNCEAEIIAEDYSYLYSGYGYDAMASKYGYPGEAVRVWLGNIGSADLLNPVTNNPPIVSIVEPVEAAVLSGDVDFKVNASDDLGISKVRFYVDSTLILEDLNSPYQAVISTARFASGNHELKVIASDGTLETTSTLSVNFQNDVVDTEKPTIDILAPAANPFTTTSADISISLVAHDNNKIEKIELIFNDIVQGSWDRDILDIAITLSGHGNYSLTFRAYDDVGNYTDSILVVDWPE